MDIEKLIEQLKGISNGLVEDEFPKCANAVRQAATALSTLRAENERLKNKLSELAHLPFDKPGMKRELDEAREAICTQGGVSICRYGI